VLLLQELLVRRLAKEPPPSTPGSPDAARRKGAPIPEYRLLGHCTESTNAPESRRQWQFVFERFGLSLRLEAVGCCGMAGTFGHLAGHRETSDAIYRMSWGRHLAPGTASDPPPLATGYSCRSQAEVVDGLRIRHPVQALLQALRQSAREA